MDNFFIPNSFLPTGVHDRRWLERQKHLYANPKEYKEHLKQGSDEHWKQAISGGVNEEMSKKEAIRKKEARQKEEKELDKSSERILVQISLKYGT